MTAPPCPTHPLPDCGDYLAWHRDADRRQARGERQQFCGACLRYRWPDERAGGFVAERVFVIGR